MPSPLLWVSLSFPEQCTQISLSLEIRFFLLIEYILKNITSKSPPFLGHHVTAVSPFLVGYHFAVALADSLFDALSWGSFLEFVV